MSVQTESIFSLSYPFPSSFSSELNDGLSDLIRFSSSEIERGCRTDPGHPEEPKDGTSGGICLKDRTTYIYYSLYVCSSANEFPPAGTMSLMGGQ